MKRYQIIMFLLLVLPAAWLRAAPMQNLYDEQLEVEAQSSQTLREGAATALERVLIRVSGKQNVAEHPSIAEALRNAEPMLTQYRYHSQANGQGEQQLLLQVSFSPRQVNGLLQSAGLPVWSSNRPPVLVWLVEDTAEGRHFVNSDTNSDLYQALIDQAGRRGLALQFPLMDLVDTANLSVEEVWQMQVDRVNAASARYGGAYTLVGRASELSNGQWVASWMVLQSEGDRRLDSEGMDGRETVAPVVDLLADLQARNFSVVVGGNSESTLIYVDGIRDFTQYARLVTYLENLSVIQHANTVWLSDSALVIDLSLNDDMSKVERFLSLDSQLQEMNQAPMVDPKVAAMSVRSFYRWQGY